MEDREKIFFKSRWIREPSTVTRDGKKQDVTIEQQLIVSYSIKCRDYLRSIRDGQVEHAERMVRQGESHIDPKAIEAEAAFDGFYAVYTNLEDDPETIVGVNKRRWEIEECFRIMKTDFGARPVYVQRKDRILAHFITCKMRNVISQTKMGEYNVQP